MLVEHGGLDGTVDDDKLGATLARPTQKFIYDDPTPSVFELAAAYGYGFARNHCFTDGNKRVALVAIDSFLMMNGFELIAPEVEATVVITDLAGGNLTEAELCAWIEENSQALTDV